jgi:hypothetical protein
LLTVTYASRLFPENYRASHSLSHDFVYFEPFRTEP